MKLLHRPTSTTIRTAGAGYRPLHAGVAGGRISCRYAAALRPGLGVLRLVDLARIDLGLAFANAAALGDTAAMGRAAALVGRVVDLAVRNLGLLLYRAFVLFAFVLAGP